MKTIGDIRELEKNEDYPSIYELINKPIKEKQKIIEYMKKAEILAVAPAAIRDVLNPEIRIPDLFLMGDGVYEWRSDIVYYLERYDLELPEEFLDHVFARLNTQNKDEK